MISYLKKSRIFGFFSLERHNENITRGARLNLTLEKDICKVNIL